MNTSLLRIESTSEITTVIFDRSDRANAINAALLQELNAFFSSPPAGCRAIVLTGAGKHFSSGLDLSEHDPRRTPLSRLTRSRHWHAVMDQIQFGGLPIVAVLHGAVIGGGLELATACHVRVAEHSAFYQLPEGQRGLYVGGGASVRVRRIIGADRMTAMMLTGERVSSAVGHRWGLSHVLVPNGTGLSRGQELAAAMAQNPPLSNYLIIHGLANSEDMGSKAGLFTEALAAALVRASPDADAGVATFLKGDSPAMPP